MKPSPPLSAEIARRLADAKAHSPTLVSPDGTALMLYGDIGGCAYIRPDGEILYWGHDDDAPSPGSSGTAIASIVIGSQRFPELQELLPPRPPTASDCPACAGSGKFRQYDIICGSCNGLGWTSTA